MWTCYIKFCSRPLTLCASPSLQLLFLYFEGIRQFCPPPLAPMRHRKICFYFCLLFALEVHIDFMHNKRSTSCHLGFSFSEPHKFRKAILQQKHIKVSLLLHSFLLYPLFWLDQGTFFICVTTSDWSLDSSIWSSPETSSTLLRNRSASASSFLLVRDGPPFKITSKLLQNYFRITSKLLQNNFKNYFKITSKLLHNLIMVNLFGVRNQFIS